MLFPPGSLNCHVVRKKNQIPYTNLKFNSSPLKNYQLEDVCFSFWEPGATPPKINMEPQKCRFGSDDFGLQIGDFSGEAC